MNAPSDTFIQHIAQNMTATHGLYVLGVIAGALIVALIICVVGVWREVHRDEMQLQKDLERSTRARAGGYERS